MLPDASWPATSASVFQRGLIAGSEEFEYDTPLSCRELRFGFGKKVVHIGDTEFRMDGPLAEGSSRQSRVYGQTEAGDVFEAVL